MTDETMDGWFSADTVFDGRDLRSDCAIQIVAGRVRDVVPMAKTPKNIAHFKGIVSPGFVDLQVNGGGGVMLNSTPTAAGIGTIANAHRSLGTVAIMPTVITDHAEVLRQAAAAVIEAKTDAGIIGLHIEGPHIAMARRGTHAAEFIRPMDTQTIETIAHLRENDVTVMITVAPEAVTHGQIGTLTQMGAIVSLGHTDCSAKDIKAAIAAGARCGTHLFNAMSPMQGRAPGAVGALINSNCYTGIICDGHHVSDEMVGLAVRARPLPDRMFLVSDAMATVGGPDNFSLYDQVITLKDGRLINEEGNLAGAHVTQIEGVRRLVHHCGISLETALRMATSNPANCVGRPELGQLIGRSIDALILLDDTPCLIGPISEKLQTKVQPNQRLFK